MKSMLTTVSVLALLVGGCDSQNTAPKAEPAKTQAPAPTAKAAPAAAEKAPLDPAEDKVSDAMAKGPAGAGEPAVAAGEAHGEHGEHAEQPEHGEHPEHDEHAEQE